MAKRRRRDVAHTAAEREARTLLMYGLRLDGIPVDLSKLDALDAHGLAALARLHPENGGARAALSALGMR